MQQIKQPHELGLSYDSYRAGQKEIIQRIIDSEKHYIILEAPTGAGKSLIAFSVIKNMDAAGIILIKTKQLQDQYSKSFGNNVLVLKGKSNYPCALNPRVTREDCVFEFLKDKKITDCPKFNSCKYEQIKREALRLQKIVVTNYAYFLSQRFLRTPDVLVLDECHSAEQEIIKHAKISIPYRFITSEARALFENEDYEAFFTEVNNKVEEETKEYYNQLKYYEQFDNTNEHILKLQRKIRALVTLYENIKFLKTTFSQDKWYVSSDTKYLRFEPYFGTWFFNVFYQAKQKVILMSATPPSVEVAESLFGIPKDEIEYLKMPSTFSPAIRPIKLVLTTNLGHKHLAKALPKVIAVIDRIITERHSTEKGLLHCKNYNVARYILSHSALNEHMMLHDSTNRAETLDKFKNAEPPAILLSPSFQEGVDLPYDECRFQMLVGLQFPSLADKIVQHRKTVNPSAYNWEVARSIVQAYGRGVRAQDDYCVFYILDTNFVWFFKQNEAFFTDYFKEGLSGKK